MSPRPWWVERVEALLLPRDLAGLGLGLLWKLQEGLWFVRENVEPALLEIDVRRAPELAALWSRLDGRDEEILRALQSCRREVTAQLLSGELGHAAFRRHWEALGFIEAADRPSTAADDWLDGLWGVTRLTEGAPRPEFGQVNMSSRAARISDFLAVAQPGPDDTLYDIGCGNGKVALTLAASTPAHIVGIEYEERFFQAAGANASGMGLSNLELIHADVRHVDLSRGTAFYLYYPFWGEVAQAVAEALGVIARERDILVYAAGPEYQYGEFFLAQVKAGALRLEQRRGPFSEVLVLRSARVGPVV